MSTDSKLESALHYHKIDQLLPYYFDDSEGWEWNTKIDYAFLTEEGRYVYVELKDSELNSVKTYRTATNNLINKCERHQLHLPSPSHDRASSALWRYNRKGSRDNVIKNAFNHSAVQQQIINETLKEDDIQFLVVFANPPATVEYRKKHIPYKLYYWQRYGLKVMSLDEFRKQSQNWISLDSLPSSKEIRESIH